MRNTLKLTLTALIAALTLASALGTASARNLSISNRNIRVTFAPLSFSEPGGLGFRCHLSLEGSFHSTTIVKTPRALLGYITRANITQNTCRDTIGFTAHAIPWNGTETSLGRTIGQSLPWHITYEGFTGTLPNINGGIVLLRNVRFDLEDPLIPCLGSYGNASTNLRFTLNINTVTHVVTELTPGTDRVPRIAGSAECPTELSYSGRGTVSVLGASTAITVTLI